MSHGWTQNWRKLTTFLIIIAAVSALVIVTRQGLPLLAQSLRFDPPLLGLSFLVACSGLLIAVPVWRSILGAYGIRQSIHDDLRIYCYSALGVTLPGGIWSIVGRSGLYQRLGANGVAVAAASVTETFLIGISGLGVYAGTLIILPGLSLLKQPEIGLGFAVLALVMIHPRIFNRISEWVSRRTGRQVVRAEFGWGQLALWSCLEILVTVSGGVSAFILLYSFWAMPFFVLIQTIAAWALASAFSNLFFWFPGTAPARDAVMVLALSPALAMPQAILFVILWRVWTVAALLFLAGIIWLVFDSPFLREFSRF